MIYAIHTKQVGEVLTTTVHGRQASIETFAATYRFYNRYADIYVGEQVLIVKERRA